MKLSLPARPTNNYVNNNSDAIPAALPIQQMMLQMMQQIMKGQLVKQEQHSGPQKQQKPPVLEELTYNKEEPEKVSYLSSNESIILSKRDIKVLNNMRDVVEGQLKSFVKKYWYDKVKFPVNNRVTAHIMKKAVDMERVNVPKDITPAAFCEFFKKKVVTVLGTLRHNSQTLARKNWLGKLLLGFLSVLLFPPLKQAFCYFL